MIASTALRGDERFTKIAGNAAKPSEPDARGQQIAALNQRFDQELAQKDYQAAAKTCRELLALTPNNANTLYNLACVASSP